jgi:4-amino-4-deoxy-L-arabinose transferase-like glycosyltransferase
VRPNLEKAILNPREALRSRVTLRMTTLSAVLIGVALARVGATYPVFNQTWDEASHIAGGMEWLDRGSYTYEPMHTPLPRVMAALGPYLSGARSQGDRNRDIEGNRILHSLGTYDRTLTLARMGILPFFVLAAVVVVLWGARLYGWDAALWALLLFTTLPPILGHSGVATTDMAIAACLSAALFAWWLWLERPTSGRSWALGIFLGLAVLSKLSALVFLAVGGLLILLCFRLDPNRTAITGSVLSISRMRAARWVYLAAFLTIWAGYRFSVGPLVPPPEAEAETAPAKRVPPTRPTALDSVVLAVERAAVYPAPELFRGFVALYQKNQQGHRSYLLGEVRTNGWWYFFPLALGVKTPLGLLFLFAVGLGALAWATVKQQRWTQFAPALVASGLLLAAMTSGINIGVRHVLPIYPLMALVAGVGARTLWHWRPGIPAGPVLAALLVGWQVTSSFRVHPDYLAYFNELAPHPERILVDSDLDWGQDLKRLADTLRARNITELSIAYNGSADLTRHGLPTIHDLVPYQPTSGWIAISVFCLKMGKIGTRTPDEFAWLERFDPVARVGSSIWLYHLTDAQLRAGLQGDRVGRGEAGGSRVRDVT